MAQKDDTQLKLRSDQIKNETVVNANTATRLGLMFEDIIDSKVNNDTPQAIAHSSLSGLGADDHGQYHTDARGDIRYFQKSEHIDVSTGAPDAAKPIITDSGGKSDPSFYIDFTGIGSNGTVPDPTAGTNTRVLKADGTWGEPGSGAAFLLYNFDTATADADPLSGNVRVDNTDISLATTIFISNENDAAQDVSAVLLDAKVGSKVAIQQTDDPTKAALFEVSGAIVDATTYVKIPVTFQSKGGGIGGGGTLDNGALSNVVLFAQGTAISGSDLVEDIVLDNNLDTIHERSYLLPLQITDVAGPGISSLATSYSVKTDDGAAEYSDGPSEESVSLATLNSNIDARSDGVWVLIRTIPVISRLSTIIRTKNIT